MALLYPQREVAMRWKFPTGTQVQEEKQVAERPRRSSAFYRFLWEVREERFDDAFQDALAAADAPRGQEPCPDGSGGQQREGRYQAPPASV
jgi:hypothetical protein